MLIGFFDDLKQLSVANKAKTEISKEANAHSLIMFLLLPIFYNLFKCIYSFYVFICSKGHVA